MNQTIQQPETKQFKVGDICFCWYQVIPNKLNSGEPMGKLDMFWCKILHMRNEYCTCELYFGDDYDPSRVKGIFDGVCVADLVWPTSN